MKNWKKKELISEELLRKPGTAIIFIIAACVLSRLMMYIVYCMHTNNHDYASFRNAMNIWDSGWYNGYVMNIVEGKLKEFQINEYGQSWWAFFPLFPAIMAGLYKVFGSFVSLYTLGMIANSAFLCAAEFVAYKYVMLTKRNIWTAYAYIAFMSFGLYSFYFTSFYTESLFLFLLTLCFYYAKKEDYIKMGIAGALLSATRNVGVLFVFVVLADRIVKYIKDKKKGNFIVACLSDAKLVLGVVLVPLGAFLYMLLLSWCTGDGFAFMHVQVAWNRGDAGLIANLISNVINTFPASYYGIYTIIIIIIFIIAFRETKKIEELIFPLMVFYVAAFSSLMSLPRFVIGSFTFVLAFADLFVASKKSTKIIIGILVFVYEIVLIMAWFDTSYLMW